MSGAADIAFLLSSDRSGSNMVLRMLGAHSAICAPPTTHLFATFGPLAGRYDDVSTDAGWQTLQQDIAELLDAGLGEWRTRGALDGHTGERTLASALAHVHAEEARAAGKSTVIVKAHQAGRYADWLTARFPDARFIHLVRDPRDMALSWLDAKGLRGGVVRAARVWAEDQTGFEALTSRLGPHCIRVRYEDVLSAPEDVLQDLAHHLGREFEAGMLDFHRNVESRTMSGAVDAWRNLQKPLMAGNSGKFASRLDREQIAYIETVCSDGMARYGYARLSEGVDDLDALEVRLSAAEPWDKAAYAELSERERSAHGRLRDARERIIQSRPRPPLGEPR